MSSHGYATPLIAEPRRSRILAGCRLFTSAAASGAAFLLPTAWTAIALVCLVAALVLERGRLRAAGRLEWRADGCWHVATPRGRRQAVLAPGSYCSRWLVVLVLDAGRERFRRVLVRDSLDPETWRRLQVRLRLEGTVT